MKKYMMMIAAAALVAMGCLVPQAEAAVQAAYVSPSGNVQISVGKGVHPRPVVVVPKPPKKVVCRPVVVHHCHAKSKHCHSRPVKHVIHKHHPQKHNKHHGHRH